MTERETILVVLSSESDASRVVESSVDIAFKKGANLYVLYIIEEERASYIKRFGETDFVSKDTSQKIEQALIRDKRQTGYELMKKIEEKAKSKEISVRSSIIFGDITDETIKISDVIHPEEIVIFPPEGGRIKRLIRGDRITKIEQKTGVPVKIIR